MGGTSVAITSPYAAVHNLAGLGNLDGGFAAIALRQSLVSSDMNLYGLAVATPLPFGGVGLQAQYFGDADYNEKQLTAAYGMPVNDELSLAVGFHLLHSSTSDPYYDPLLRLTFSLAVQYSPLDDLVIGFRTFNPVAMVAETNQAVRIAALFNLGVSYRIVNDLMATVEVEKNVYYDASLRFGMEYLFADYFAARVGAGTAPTFYSFGVAVRLQHLAVDLAAQVHSLLGISPLIALSYNF